MNTRLDRILSITNTLYYGILIMDKAREYPKRSVITPREITSVWFAASSERDKAFQIMTYACFLTNSPL